MRPITAPKLIHETLKNNHFDIITKVMADIELLKNQMAVARFIVQTHKDIMEGLKRKDGKYDYLCSNG